MVITAVHAVLQVPFEFRRHGAPPSMRVTSWNRNLPLLRTREEYLFSNRSISPCVARVRRSVCRVSMRSQLWMSSSRAGVQKSRNFSRASSTVIAQAEPPSVRNRTRPSLAYWENPFRKRRNSSLFLRRFPFRRRSLLNLENQGMKDRIKLFQRDGRRQLLRCEAQRDGVSPHPGIRHIQKKFVIGAQAAHHGFLRVCGFRVRIRPGKESVFKILPSLPVYGAFPVQGEQGLHGAPVSPPWGQSY